MNKERILQIADAIENHTLNLGFNLTFFKAEVGTDIDLVNSDTKLVDHSGHNCGTVACIAGWSAELRGSPTVSINAEADWLGLEYDTAANLFGCEMYPEERNAVAQAQAIRTLHHLAATGEVDWTV